MSAVQEQYAQTIIIIPTYNEVDNIEKMIRLVFSLYPNISLLIINDRGTDGTAQKVKELQSEFGHLNLIEREGKLGLGTAYAAGFEWAIKKNFKFIVQMDCDFSHDPKEVSTLIQGCKDQDLVIGSRYIGGIRIINWSFKRLLLSYLASQYVRFVTRLPVFDTTGGFKCMKASFIEELDLKQLKSNGYIFQLEINYKAFCLNKKISEVPITFYEREIGESKMDGNIIFEALISVIRLRLLRFFGKLV